MGHHRHRSAESAGLYPRSCRVENCATHRDRTCKGGQYFAGGFHGLTCAQRRRRKEAFDSEPAHPWRHYFTEFGMMQILYQLSAVYPKFTLRKSTAIFYGSVQKIFTGAQNDDSLWHLVGAAVVCS